eukprot:5354475-Pleurochrysis_carterae.AAC.1
MSGGALGKSAGHSARGDRKSERRRSRRGGVRRTRWSDWGWGREGENKESSTAPAACARELLWR